MQTGRRLLRPGHRLTRPSPSPAPEGRPVRGGGRGAPGVPFARRPGSRCAGGVTSAAWVSCSLRAARVPPHRAPVSRAFSRGNRRASWDVAGGSRPGQASARSVASRALTRVPAGAPCLATSVVPAACPGRRPTEPASAPPRPPRPLLPLGPSPAPQGSLWGRHWPSCHGGRAEGPGQAALPCCRPRKGRRTRKITRGSFSATGKLPLA